MLAHATAPPGRLPCSTRANTAAAVRACKRLTASCCSARSELMPWCVHMMVCAAVCSCQCRQIACTMHRTMRGVFHGVGLLRTRYVHPNSRKAVLHFAVYFISAKLPCAAFEMIARHAVQFLQRVAHTDPGLSSHIHPEKCASMPSIQILGSHQSVTLVPLQ